MPPFFGSYATLVVATLYCAWRTYFQGRLRKTRTLRERVAYMLWVVADRTPAACPVATD